MAAPLQRSLWSQGLHTCCLTQRRKGLAVLPPTSLSSFQSVVLAAMTPTLTYAIAAGARISRRVPRLREISRRAGGGASKYLKEPQAKRILEKRSHLPSPTGSRAEGARLVKSGNLSGDAAFVLIRPHRLVQASGSQSATSQDTPLAHEISPLLRSMNKRGSTSSPSALKPATRAISNRPPER